jgi:hypothetical protein
MLSDPNPISVQVDSDQEELLQLVQQICPKEESEPTCAYKAFSDLVISGSSIKKLAEEYHESATSPTTDIDVLKAWAEDYDWRSRLKRWKSIRKAYERQLQQQREQQFLHQWNNRRGRLFEAADRVLARAEVILKLPPLDKTIYEEVVAEYPGQIIPTTTVIMASRWKSTDIAGLKTALELMKQIIGDREIMIDRLVSDGYIITDPSLGEENMTDYLAAIERLEEIQAELF